MGNRKENEFYILREKIKSYFSTENNKLTIIRDEFVKYVKELREKNPESLLRFKNEKKSKALTDEENNRIYSKFSQFKIKIDQDDNKYELRKKYFTSANFGPLVLEKNKNDESDLYLNRAFYLFLCKSLDLKFQTLDLFLENTSEEYLDLFPPINIPEDKYFDDMLINLGVVSHISIELSKINIKDKLLEIPDVDEIYKKMMLHFVNSDIKRNSINKMKLSPRVFKLIMLSYFGLTKPVDQNREITQEDVQEIMNELRSCNIDSSRLEESVKKIHSYLYQDRLSIDVEHNARVNLKKHETKDKDDLDGSDYADQIYPDDCLCEELVDLYENESQLVDTTYHYSEKKLLENDELMNKSFNTSLKEQLIIVFNLIEKDLIGLAELLNREEKNILTKLIFKDEIENFIKNLIDSIKDTLKIFMQLRSNGNVWIGTSTKPSVLELEKLDQELAILIREYACDKNFLSVSIEEERNKRKNEIAEATAISVKNSKK